MSSTVQVKIKHLIDGSPCYQMIRELRWPDGITCPLCQSTQVIKTIEPLIKDIIMPGTLM
jgi:hypothetical protein